MPPSLAISVVTYAPILSVVEQVLISLDQALCYARQRNILGETRLFLTDNGPGDAWRTRLLTLLANRSATSVELLSGHGNIGYGAGHNLAIRISDCDFHLVLNPDAMLDKDALYQALCFMADHPNVGLLAPAAVDGDGNRQYVCKAYPSVFDLLLRGFAPALLKKPFRNRLNRYQLHDLIGDRVVWDVPIVSGCFMLFRSSVLSRLEGFSPAYFLYFEDFDLSLRTAEIARIAYVPGVRITHFGGHAAGKGWRHVAMFIRSATTFFQQHGWKWL